MLLSSSFYISTSSKDGHFGGLEDTSGKVAGKEVTAEEGLKNSLSSKLWSGDEDRALCEVISNAHAAQEEG